jgi:HEPN domain-containing protein
MIGTRKSAAERKKDRLRALLYLAEHDTDAARVLAAHGNHYAAYHCQQAAEKLIRALLFRLAGERPCKKSKHHSA